MLAAGQPVGIEPQAHRVLALAEDDDVADAGDALEVVLDEAIDVVADEERVVLVLVGVHAGGRARSCSTTLVTEMPTVFTSFGSRPSTCEMRFCTSTAARSRLRVTSKVTVTVDVPSLPLVEVMYCMPSTPLIACSSGVVTAVSTVSALAPL